MTTVSCRLALRQPATDRSALFAHSLIFSLPQILKERVSEEKHDRRKERLCHKIDWVIVPVLNVDGYVHSWSKVGANILHINSYL